MSSTVLSRYQDLSVGTKAFLSIRWKLTPYEVMAEKMPREGTILDLGCGHGLFAFALALGSSSRQVLGIDHDTARVALGEKAASGLGNLRFEQGSVLAPPPGSYAGVSLIDVMHYFPPALQEQILIGINRCLVDGGTILIRDVNPNAGVISSLNRGYEAIATKIGFTRSNSESNHFRTPEEWTRALHRAGFEVTSEPCSHFLFADHLFVGRKRS
jgi:2-polyprenyl-6-hydroxyphenyl methylase/3-demethylubiquinone-9 3-methyltransferase